MTLWPPVTPMLSILWEEFLDLVRTRPWLRRVFFAVLLGAFVWAQNWNMSAGIAIIWAIYELLWMLRIGRR